MLFMGHFAVGAVGLLVVVLGRIARVVGVGHGRHGEGKESLERPGRCEVGIWARGRGGGSNHAPPMLIILEVSSCDEQCYEKRASKGKTHERHQE